MAGSTGPTVTVQTPLSSFWSACAPLMKSAETCTSTALGAASRNVTVRSGFTCAEGAGGDGRCAAAIAQHSAASRVALNIALVSYGRVNIIGGGPAISSGASGSPSAGPCHTLPPNVVM